MNERIISVKFCISMRVHIRVYACVQKRHSLSVRYTMKKWLQINQMMSMRRWRRTKIEIVFCHTHIFERKLEREREREM